MHPYYFSCNDFPCSVAMLPVPHLPISVLVLYLPLQLAHFRQRKTKGQGSKAQKKTQKRKGEAVPANDVPPKEDTLIKGGSSDDPLLLADHLLTEVSLEYSSLDVSEDQSKMSDSEAGLEIRQEGTEQYLVDNAQFQKPVEENSSELLHQELQSVVRSRDEIITQLSSNLQQALLNRKEMAEEALCLSNQIQAIQLQLQDASRVLKRKSLGKKELHEAQQQFAIIHSSLMDQTVKRAQDLERELETSHKTTKEKENQMARLENLLRDQQKRLEILQEKLDLSESSVSHLQQELSERNQEVRKLQHGLSVPIKTEFTLGSDDDKGGGEKSRVFVGPEDSVESLSRLVIDLKEKLAESESLRESLVKKIEKQMEAFETERMSWEQKHNDDVLSLKGKLNHAEQTVAQEKNEKDCLNQEIYNLKENLRLLEENQRELNLQHDKDLQTYILKLQNLDTEKLFSIDKEEIDADESKKLVLDDSKVDHFRHEFEDIKKNLSRVKARKEEDCKTDEFKKEDCDDLVFANKRLTLMDKYLIPSQSELFELSYSNEDIGDHSRFELDSDFVLEHSIDSMVDANIPLFCSPMPITGVLAGGATLGKDLDPESFAIYLSSNLGLSDEKNNQSLKLGENALDRCRALTEQLQNKEQQLQKSSEALEEAIAKWREVTAELSASQLELERDKANKHEHFEEQQRLIEDLKKEKNVLQHKLGQEQNFKEMQEQLSTKDGQLRHVLQEYDSVQSRLCMVEKELERALELNKNLQVSNVNLIQNLLDFEKARELERQEFDNKLNFKGLEQQVLQEAIKTKEDDFFKIEQSLQEELDLLKQVNEDLESKLREMHAHNVDTEALRLSLNNMHTAQLELSQSNLLKEKENALIQLRETFNEKRAQEVALLQSRHQFELAHLREKHDEELKNLKHDLLQEILGQQEQHSREVEQLRAEKMAEALEMQEMFKIDMETCTEHYQQSKEEWTRQQDQHFHELKLVQDKLHESLGKIESRSKDIELLKEQYAKEVSELKQLHIKERDDLTTLCVDQEEQLRRQQDGHSKDKELLSQKHLQEILQQKEQQSETIEKIRFDFSEEVKQLKEQHNKENETIKELLSKEKEWEIQNELCEELKKLQAEPSKEKLHQQHSEEISLLREKHAIEVSHLQEQHDQEMKRLEESHVLERQEWENQKTHYSQEIKRAKEEIKQITQKCTTEILQLRDLFNKKKEELLAAHNEDKRTWERQQVEHSQKILQLKDQCKEMETLLNLLTEEKEDWKKERDVQFKEIMLLKEEICSKTTQLQEQHLKAVKELQEQHAKAVKEIEEQHILEREEWEKERDLCSQELDQMVNQHSQELKRIGEEISQASLQKQEEYTIMLETLREDCSKKILNLQNQHSREMVKIMELHAKEREQWENPNIQNPVSIDEHLQGLRKLKEQHEKELKELLDFHELEKIQWEKWQEEHFNGLTYLVNHQFQQVKGYLDDHSGEMEEHAVEILAFQEQHQKEVETMQELYVQKKLKLENRHRGSTEDEHNGEHTQPQVVPLLDQSEDQSKDLEQEMQGQKLHVRSSQQIQLLWAQVDSSRASRQELHELKEQLIARSMHLEEIERMKRDFHKQQQQLKATHEKDMEDLRIYFEQKSSAAEETYRENLELLHQRLRDMSDEGKEEMPALNSSALALDESFECEKTDLLLHLTDQLVLQKEALSNVQHESEMKHKQEIENLRSVLTIQYEEDVANMKKGLSDKYALEFEALKRRHSLDLEHLRARLSERHIKEITKMHLESSCDAVCHKEKSTNIIQSLVKEIIHAVEVATSEPSSSDPDFALKLLDKYDKSCQTDSAACSSCKHASDEVQDSMEKAVIKDKMASEMAKLTKTVHAERTRVLKALKEVKSRTKQFLVDKANLQRTLSRESQTSNISKDDSSELISNLLTHSEDLLSSDEEHKLEPDFSISELQEHFSELHYHLDQDINFTSHLEASPNKDLLSCLLDLLQRHQDELHYSDLEHKAHIQSLEASHLLKLDTLEASYLSEIQKIRDEHTLAVEELEFCLSSRLQEKDKEIQEMLEKARVHWLHLQEQELQHLRQDLASVHLEKFQAMAEELKVAHQDDLKEKLDQQHLQLEYEKGQALDALKEEVLRMEESNELALQELSSLHKMEVQQQTQMLQDELLKLMGDLQKQEVIITELTSQRLELSSELQDKTSQLLQLQEEIELLKCQSEMLLEQQITQLKDEFAAEKRSAVQELKEGFTRDMEKIQEEQNLEKKGLVMELEEKNVLVVQLQEKVSDLTKEMEELQSQVEAIVQTERESHEGKNLETILQYEAQIARQEQERLQESCQRLLKIFTDVLKNTLVTEDLIFKKIGLCLDSSLSQIDEERNKDTLTKSAVLKEKSRLSPDCYTITEHSLMSTDEGYEVSEYLCDTVLGSLEVGLENEDKIVQMSQRLRYAVERLLDMVSDSAVQLEQTRETQKSFEEEFKSRNQEMAQVVVQNQDLQKWLAQETEIKNQMQVELHKAQGLLEGFAAEKSALEEALSTKETSEHQLVVELEKSQEQLKVLTQEPSALGVEKELLLRLQEVLSGSEKDTEVELLKEVQRLVKEKLELHCQADKDRSNLLSQMRVLEMELEEQMSQNQELMRKTSEMTDLKQQIQSLEKQLKHQRHFMDEQAVEREHERDDFQQEIQSLEEQLKQAMKTHGDSRAYRLYDWSEQNEPLETNIKERADLNLLLEGKSHLEQQIAERNEEIDKMLMRIQELEQAALSNADAAKRCSQLEAELQRIQRIENELLQDKEALQQQQYNNVLQISALQSKLDETRHRVPVEGEPDALLKKELQAEREALQRKEKEAENLAEQLELFREELTNKTEEVFQLKMQLEIQRKQSEIAVQHAQEEYLRIKDELSSLQLERAQEKPSASLELPQALLQEKNQEIDHLNEQILSLQHEAADVEELRSLVEHLRSDQERLHKSKEEEVEQLHEVIEKLQQELEQLGPIRHEVSDSQESLDRLGMEGTDNLQTELSRGAKRLEDIEKERLEDTKSLYETELEALRLQREEKDALHITEVEVLETNLQNLHRLNRQQEQALEFLQGTHGDLQEETELLRTHLSQREEAVVGLSDQVQRLQDSLREKNAILTEKELQVQTLQEQNAGDVSELRNQLAQSFQSLEATKIDLQRAQEQNVFLQDALSNSSQELNVYKEEIRELKQCLGEWEEKSEKLLKEEAQTQTDVYMAEVEIRSHLAALKEQLSVADNLANEQKAKLDSKESELMNLNGTVKELLTECECWKTEAQHVQQQLKKRDACVSELQSHSQNLGMQVKKLQQALMSQESMISVISNLQKQNGGDRSNKQSGQSRTKAKEEASFSESLTDLNAWDSPDMVRKQEEQMHSLRALTPYSELSIDHSALLDVMKSKSSGCVQQPACYNLVGSSTPSLSDSIYSLQHSSHTQRSSPVREIGHPLTDYDSCDDPQSSGGDRTDTEQSNELDYKTEAGNNVVLDDVGDLFDLKQKMDSMSGSGLSPQLQRMLNMVHEESCKILELSEGPFAKAPSPESTELVIQRDVWLKEKEKLQETIQSLSSALAQAAGKGEKDGSLDWRRDLLQSVQSLLESEREYLRLELQSQLHHGAGDNNSLSDKVEHLIREQEEQKRLVLEHVLAVDRSSLLSEIQDLRAQLRMAHLQNQEKLQQLQDALTSAEEKGHTKEHHLRKQVELYEYKLQQEAAIAEDLKGSLLREQERSSEQHRLLLQEQSTVSQLRSELEELQLDLENRKRLQNEMQIEISKLRDELENKEQATSLLMHTVQSQQVEESKRSEKEKAAIQQELALKEKSLQEAYSSIEEHRKLNAKISSVLLQEQTCTSNLRKELEIEQSRCKALLAQEHKKLMEAEQELGREKQHSASLSSALTLERNVVEQLKQQHSLELSRQDKERHQEHELVLTLQCHLEEERKRARDLAAMMEQTQQQAVHAKRQLESENQACREEIQKEQEAGVKLRALLEALQSQKQQLDSVMDQQREREIRLQKERDQYKAQLLILQEEERVWLKEREKETRRSKQLDINRTREEEEQERHIMDLKLQHERDVRRIQELQHMLADLEEQERALAARKSRVRTETTSPSKNLGSLAGQMQKVFQQLLHTVLQVKKWVHNKGESFPDEAEVAALLDSLSELKSDLQRGTLQLPAVSPPIVVDVLKRENEELATTVSQLTKEKLELRNQLAKLNKSLQEPLRKEIKEQLHSDAIESVLEAERAAWNREKRLLQIALKHAESELGKATLENKPVSEVPNSKMQRLYRKYLRAESFRKALVYQKKYLLLLLGGFQACEKATLSLIARMGVYPSPADLQVPPKHQSGLTKFRSAVRAVIAISRLKFLVRKWHKGSSKSVAEPVVQQVQTHRRDVLQHLSGTLLNSPPTRDTSFDRHNNSSITGTPSPKSSHWASRRIGHSPARTPERSPYASRDPEHSITEYIHHLEMVQRRLGGGPNAPSPELPGVKYARK